MRGRSSRISALRPMAFPVAGAHGGAAKMLSSGDATNLITTSPLRHHLLSPSLLSPCPPLALRTSHVVSAKRFSSRSERFDSRKRRSATTTKEEEEGVRRRQDSLERGLENVDQGSADAANDEADDGYFLPNLPGDEPDFWEGPQWDGLGFFVRYMWAFGVGFALIASVIAAATYNEGATDFKQTPAYKESIQSRDLLEEPEGSSPDVFESNPTEVAPALE